MSIPSSVATPCLPSRCRLCTREDARTRPPIAFGRTCNNLGSEGVLASVAPSALPRRQAATEATTEQKERFRDLAAAELPRLHGIARRLVGEDAEDAVQDCLLKAFRGFDGLGSQGAARAWLTAILVNC